MPTGVYFRTEENKKNIIKAQMGRTPWNKGLKCPIYSKRMKENNPMKNREIRIKQSQTRKRLFKEGKLKPWNYIDGRSKLKSPNRYGDDWDKIRYLIYLRDRFTCQDCGIIGVRLDIHHKIPFLKSFDNSLNNLITLCRSCHMKEEARIMKELKNIKIEV